MKKNITANNKADIMSREIKRDFKYKDVVVLNFDVTYPVIKLMNSSRIQKRINTAYQNIVSSFYNYVRKKMYPDAVENYNEAIKNNFPFHTHDAVMKYTVTLNDFCRLSTYFDQYQYTGGAHGMTYRFSQNFNIQTGQVIELKDLFPKNVNYREVVLKQILIEAEKNLEENPGIYFENYKELIVKNFNPESFNLTPTGVDIYYQQYDIAPYSTGIVVFNLSYESLGIERPHCEKY